MTLSDDGVKEEMESWRGFANALRADDRELFKEMLRLCYQYAPSMEAKSSPFISEALLMSLVLMQHKMISWMEEEIKKLKAAKVEGLDP